MSLRLRLVITIGLALCVLWAAAATWLWRDLNDDLNNALDQRLAMSANMVASLVDLPVRQSQFNSHDSAVTLVAGRGMACQIRTPSGDILAATATAPPSLSFAARPGYHTLHIGGHTWRTYTLQTNALIITTADRMSTRRELYSQIALTVSVPFIIAIIGGLLTLWLGTGRGIKPLRRLRIELSKRSPNDLKPLKTQPLPKEVQPLVTTLNTLFERTAKTIERERSFTNDAAHELRTPLTAIRTHLQLAQLTQGEDALQALNNADLGAKRLQATLEQLLLLARVEGRLPFDEDQSISASIALDRAIAACAAKDGRIQPPQEAFEQTLAVAPALAVVALRNLIENALHYSPKDTPVVVDITAAKDNVTFSVKDFGAGMSQSQLTQANQRFWRAGEANGSGLGLAIVAAIVQRYQGHLELTNHDQGLLAYLSLPAKK